MRHERTKSKRCEGDRRDGGRARRHRSCKPHRQFDRTGLRRLCADLRHAAVRPRTRDLPARADREGVAMSNEVALMSLTAVAKAIAARQVSSREVTQSCLHRIAQWQPKLNA